VESDCFATAEATLVFPHLSSLLSAPVGLGANGASTAVALRNAHLDTTVSPLFQIGAFRFGPGFAELVFSYRILATDGTDLFPAFDGTGAGVFRSRLNLQTFGLDCVRNDCPLGPDSVLSWEAGARLQVVFFDTQAQTASSFQHARNYFFGAGPHVGLGLTTALTERVSLVSRFDTAFLVGYNTAQNFEVVTNDPVNGVLSGRFSQQQTEISPTFSVRTGLSWCPRWLPACRVGAGYQFEQWYNLGRVERSRGDLSAHGLFVNGEWRF
jgi:hypothetical protein